MLKIVPSALVSGRKYLVQAGYPESMTPDIVIVNDVMPSAYTSLNAHVLISALINSPQFLEEFGYKLISKKEYDDLVHTIVEPPLDTPPVPVDATDVAASDGTGGRTKESLTAEDKQKLKALRDIVIANTDMPKEAVQNWLEKHLDIALDENNELKIASGGHGFYFEKKKEASDE